ncbi:MAG: cyclic nucleotide-binding domain-containing protein [Leptospira sp.]|jgi:signal-transduction protein with cAMP-binding, CBS, and nucleotidyltransferase domain|nr:cyclic nucleotide-binding domain-containing protein [Leptospira sp.]NCS94974.1 cyclic nucleotide-binding domain-containing protein [Leptospira sp.]
MNIYEFVTNLDSRIYHLNEVIADEYIGDIEDKLYFILKGRVEVKRTMEPDIELKTEFLNTGDIFGFAVSPSKLKVQSVYKSIDVNTKVGYLDNKAIIHIGKTNPLFFFSLLKSSIDKLLKIEKEISLLSENISSLQEGII